MSISIISASQFSGSGADSISLRAAGLLKNRIERNRPGQVVKIIDLRRFGVQPCIMCGDCSQHPRCSRDAPFNDVLEQIRDSSELALIVPMYAGLPSRLVILLEKLQEMFWLRYSRDGDTSEILQAKRVGICAHGGQVEGFEDSYQQNIIAPLTNCFHALGLRVLNDNSPSPICFGVTGYETPAGQQIPVSRHDMETVTTTVNRLADLFDQE